MTVLRSQWPVYNSSADSAECSVGGLADGLVVELANGSNAVVLNMDEKVVRLDANPMLAGKQLVFELELLSIEPTI